MRRLVVLAGIGIAVYAGFKDQPKSSTDAEASAKLTVDLSRKFIAVEGNINRGDNAEFSKRLARMPTGSTLFLTSNGGDLDEALKMAARLRSSNITKVVAQNDGCYSACVILFAAVEDRVVIQDAKIGVHRALSDGVEDSSSITASNVYATFLLNHGMPKSVALQLYATPPYDIYDLSDDELTAWGVRVMRCPTYKGERKWWKPCD